MPDTINYEGGYPLRLKDNGDGTFSPAVSVTGSGGLATPTGWGPLVNGDQIAVLDSGLVGDGEVLGLHIQTLATGGSVTVEVTADTNPAATIWTAIRGAMPSSGAPAGTISGAGYYVYSLSGAYQWRIRQTARTSGTTVGWCVVTKGVGSGVREMTLLSGTNFVGAMGLNTQSGAGGIAANSRIASSAATTNPTSAKTSVGRLFRARAYNATATVKYLKFYNKASAPTVGTDVPVITIALKPNDTTDVDFGAIGYSFATGIAYAITGAAADNDTTALTAGDVTGVNVMYA